MRCDHCNSLLQKKLDASLLFGERSLLDGVEEVLRLIVLLKPQLGLVARGSGGGGGGEPVSAGDLQHLPRSARCGLGTTRCRPEVISRSKFDFNNTSQSKLFLV